MRSWRCSVKPDPVTGAGDGMLLIPSEVMEFFDWKVGTQLRLEASDAGLHVVRYHRRPRKGGLQ